MHTHLHSTVPLVLKKHSPLLCTERHGTLALRMNSKGKKAPPVVFAMSEKKQYIYEKIKKQKKPLRKHLIQMREISVSLTYFEVSVMSHKNSSSLFFLSVLLFLLLLLSFTLLIVSLFPFSSLSALCVSFSVPLLNWCTISLLWALIFIPYQYVFIPVLISTFILVFVHPLPLFLVFPAH